MKSTSTLQDYQTAKRACSDVFLSKMKDYGLSWQILRLASITDQILIKAQRIRTIQDKGTMKVDESIEQGFVGIVNYSIMYMIKADQTINTASVEDVSEKYLSLFEEIEALMIKKNHDYGEAWRMMRVSSITDMILQKILRIKHIEMNKGKITVSEGVDSGYKDIVNYSLFALIKLGEGEKD